MAKIGSPRSSASWTAANSQRSRSGSICLSNNEGSRTFWLKNSGEISEPPVSRSPSIWSRRTFRFRAFQTLISGCLRKIGRNHFASFARIHVARLGMKECAMQSRLCQAPVCLCLQTRRSPTQEPDDVKKGSQCGGNHKIACLGPEFATRCPSGPRESHVEQAPLRYSACIWRPDDEELAKIKSGMPADCPPKRSCDTNADADHEAEGENHSDIDYVLVRFHQMEAGKQRARDKPCGPEPTATPEALQRVTAQKKFLSDTDK